jgi:hypothetical protein
MNVPKLSRTSPLMQEMGTMTILSFIEVIFFSFFLVLFKLFHFWSLTLHFMLVIKDFMIQTGDPLGDGTGGMKMFFVEDSIQCIMNLTTTNLCFLFYFCRRVNMGWRV